MFNILMCVLIVAHAQLATCPLLDNLLEGSIEAIYTVKFKLEVVFQPQQGSNKPKV